MAKRRKVIPWPIETRPLYQASYNEILRIEAMLLTCLAEAEVDNCFVFRVLFPQVARQVRHINSAAREMILYAPEGQGAPPKWFKIARRLERLSQVIAETLDSAEMQHKLREHRFIEVTHDAKSILLAIRYIKEQLVSIPLDSSRIVMTVSGFAEVVLNR